MCIYVQIHICTHNRYMNSVYVTKIIHSMFMSESSPYVSSSILSLFNLTSRPVGVMRWVGELFFSVSSSISERFFVSVEWSVSWKFGVTSLYNLLVLLFPCGKSLPWWFNFYPSYRSIHTFYFILSHFGNCIF